MIRGAVSKRKWRDSPCFFAKNEKQDSKYPGNQDGFTQLVQMLLNSIIANLLNWHLSAF